MIINLFIISMILILTIHYLLLCIINNNENFENNENYNEDNMNNELEEYIKNNNICNNEFDINKYNDNKIYEIENIEEKTSPYNLLSNINVSNFCSDKNIGLQFFKKNKNKLNKFLKKNNVNKCVQEPLIDNQNYNQYYIDSDKTISKDDVKYDDEKILNGGDFFNGIHGYTDSDLNNTYSSYNI